MTKGMRSSSPFYVHVSEDTPVHLHIEKTKKPTARAVDQPLKKPTRRSKEGEKAISWKRSQTVENERASPNVYITSKRKSSPSASDLEYEMSLRQPAMDNMRREQDIDDFVHKTQHTAAAAASSLSLLPRKGDNTPVPHTMEHFLEENEEIRKLTRKLLEAEIITETTQQEVNKFFKLIPDVLLEGHFVTGKDVHLLSALQENALSRMSELLLVATELRSLLRTTYDLLINMTRLQDENNHIHTRATDYEDLNRRLQKVLIEKDKHLEDLQQQLNKLHDEQRNYNSVHDSLESTKAHLQKQLRQKEADCNRMAVQVRTLEGQLVQEKLDCEYLTAMLKQRRGQTEESKDALKKAARMMKQKLQKAEAKIEELQEELAKRNTQLNTAQAVLQQKSDEIVKVSKEFTEESQNLRSRLQNAEERVVLHEERNALQQSVGQREAADNWSKEERLLRLEEENAELRGAVRMTEARLSQAELEMEGMREGLIHYEGVTKELNDSRQNERVAQLMNKLQRTQEELAHAMDHVQESERRLKSSEDQTRDLTVSVQRREETLRTVQQALEEKTKENAALMRQLESSLVDARRQTETGREKLLVKERQLHARIHELEAEVVRMRADGTRLRHEKDDIERRSQSQLQDLRNQLEHSSVSNRGMQNYIQFLKKSYSNSFGD